MMENGCFSCSPRSDHLHAFPAGLRVLVVDDDPTWLKILEKMLKKCSYEVTTCGLAREALNLLRERKDGYDIVISDVNMPDMDGFKLLEHVGLEMDLPVIMMSVDGETSRVMKGVQHGACDYLLKPIRMKELRNIWQHVFRKKIHEVRDIELFEGFDSIQMNKIGSELSDDVSLLCGDELSSLKKRKDVDNKHDDRDGETSSTKKARVVWSVDLHQKFVKAVNQIGFDKVGPKKILDLMNVPWLTRENVASHLQKYRLYLSRLQKENDSKPCVGAIKHSDLPSGDAAGSFGSHKSVNMQQTDVSNGSSYGFPGNCLLTQNSEPRSRDNERKGIVPKNSGESRKALTVDVSDCHKPRNSQMEFGNSFVSPKPDVKFAAVDSNFPKLPWCDIPQLNSTQETKPLHVDNRFSQLPLSGLQPHIQAYQQPAPPIISGSSINDTDIGCPIEIKPLYDDSRKNASHVSTSGQVSHQVLKQDMNDSNYFQSKIYVSTSTSSIKDHAFPNCISDVDPVQKNVTWEASPLAALDDDLQVCWSEGDCFSTNVGFENIGFPESYDSGLFGFPESYDSGLFANVPAHAVRLGNESSLYDLSEYSLIDQGLFT